LPAARKGGAEAGMAALGAGTSPPGMEPLASTADGGCGAASGHGTAADSVPLVEPLLSFQEHLQDRFETAWNQRCEPSRRHLETFVACLQERALVERQYAKGLYRTTAKLEVHSQQEGELPPAIDCAMVNMRNRAEQSVLLADQIDHDVAATIAAMLEQHAQVSKRISSDGQSLAQRWGEVCRVHDQLAARYGQACLEAEEASKECMKAALRPSDRMKLATRALNLGRQAMCVEREYHRAVQRQNSQFDIHLPGMSNVLAALQEMDEKRARCLHDAAMKLAVYETSWLRNVQYDLDATVKIIEGFDASAGLQDFIRRSRSSAPPPGRVAPRRFFELAAGAGPEATAPAAAVGDPLVALQCEAWRSALRGLLGRAAAPSSSPPLPSSPGGGGGGGAGGEAADDSARLAELRLCLGSGGGVAEEAPTPAAGGGAAAAAGADAAGGASEASAACRTAFCEVLREEVGLGAAPSAPLTPAPDQEDFRPLLIAQPVAFDTVVSLFSAALEACAACSDFWNGRDLMVLANKIQCYYEGQVVDVLVKVYSHPLWGRVTFWEGALFIGIAEAHIHLALSRRARAAGSEYPEVIISAFLAQFVSYMIAFGIKPEPARQCVKRTLRKHSALLGKAAEGYIAILCRTEPEAAIEPSAALTATLGSNTAAGAGTPATGGPPPSVPASASTMAADLAGLVDVPLSPKSRPGDVSASGPPLASAASLLPAGAAAGFGDPPAAAAAAAVDAAPPRPPHPAAAAAGVGGPAAGAPTTAAVAGSQTLGGPPADGGAPTSAVVAGQQTPGGPPAAGGAPPSAAAAGPQALGGAVADFFEESF